MRRCFKLLAWGVVLAIGLVVLCGVTVQHSAAERTFAEVAAVPSGIKVALVLGCSKKLPDGRSNRFFGKRIEAAAQLFEAGKCRALIVSGDNSVAGYDEPTDMKDALVAAGVPADKIHCDYAGFRTLDSVVRAQKVFGQSQVIIVSQRFHNERAIYLARSMGMDAYGFNAADAVLSTPLRLKNQAREALARVQAVLDIHVFRTQPKFLGPTVGDWPSITEFLFDLVAQRFWTAVAQLPLSLAECRLENLQPARKRQLNPSIKAS